MSSIYLYGYISFIYFTIPYIQCTLKLYLKPYVVPIYMLCTHLVMVLGGLYTLPTASLVVLLATSTTADVWHHCLGQPHPYSFSVLLRSCHIKGSCTCSSICASCQMGKSSKFLLARVLHFLSCSRFNSYWMFAVLPLFFHMMDINNLLFLSMIFVLYLVLSNKTKIKCL